MTLLPFLAAMPGFAARTGSGHTASARALAHAAVRSRPILRNAILPCEGALFQSSFQNPNNDEVAAPHQRVRRRVLKHDSFRIEQVLLPVAVLRDDMDGNSSLSARHPGGRSPPSV
jgi:hypothetical protein